MVILLVVIASNRPVGHGQVIAKTSAAHPAKAEPTKVESPPKWLALADTQEQFQQHWRIGNDPVSYSFDATNKIIDSNGSGNCRTCCPRKWKEFYCEISVPYVPAGKFDLTLNHESSASPASPQSITFELGDVLGKVPVTASLRVKLDDDYGNFVVLLNGVRVRQAASLDGPEWMNSFNCTFSSGNGNAKLELKNIHLLVYGSGPELLSNWTPPGPNSPKSESTAKTTPTPEESKPTQNGAKEIRQQPDLRPAIYNVEIYPPEATLTVKFNEGVVTGAGNHRQVRIDRIPDDGNVVIVASCSGYKSSQQWHAPTRGKVVDLQISLEQLPSKEATSEPSKEDNQPAEKPHTTFTQVDISSQANYSWLPGYLPGAPAGNVTLGSIPFNIASNAAGNQGWSAQSAGDDPDGHKSITIPVNVYGVTDVYTLINTIYGQRGPTSYAGSLSGGPAGQPTQNT